MATKIQESETLETGSLAKRVKLVDSSGNYVDAAGGGAISGSVTIQDKTTASQKLAVDSGGLIGINNFPASQAVSGPLTDTQLRASAVPVSGTFFQATQPVSGTFFQATQPVSASSLPLPSGASTSAAQTTAQASLTSIDSKLSGTLSVDDSLIGITPATGNTVSNVSSSASNVTLLASNANRRMATFYNDSTQVLYLKLGATATTSSYTVQLPALGYYELPTPAYTGTVDGIWASANGAASVGEMV